MAEVAKVAARQLPNFKLGQKQVFLPNHIITFLRKDHLPPNEACFRVPIRFTKFDLRDYLWNLYNVEVRRVRSYVKQQPLAQHNSHGHSWYRPQPLKIMTVELSQPFQWPELPKDLEPWSNELWSRREGLLEERTQEEADRQSFKIPLKSAQPLSKERKELGSLAKQFLSGEIKWTNGVILDPKWDKLVAKDEPATPAPVAAAPAPVEESKAETPETTKTT